MERWKEGRIQKPKLPPDPIVSATARLQRDLSSVKVNEYLSEAENPPLMARAYIKLNGTSKSFNRNITFISIRTQPFQNE